MIRGKGVDEPKLSMGDLLDRGQRYAESLFDEKTRVDPTALVETSDEIYVVTLPLVAASDEEDVRDAFREAIQRVVEEHRPESVTVVVEVWFNALPHLTEESRPPMRLLRREGVVVSVETREAAQAAMAEVTRWGDAGSLSDWCDAPALLVSGLTGFFDPPDEFVN